ncbi:uncharacterized protein LOC123712923 isoform X2 [Pieris brassicae]|uniref:uncharacterized protein LOC123712923 isoform X2 n=1 Tax=Pieris brassicae TaxID=7116 RepID=UPI001E65FEB9|nr:uncharacterized protein LOC123712923 isoform X2 [Pieris brassicae]
MESLEDSNNCTSMSDSFSMYERYMKSFNVTDNFYDQDSASASSISRESSNGGTIDLSIVVPQHGIATDAVCDSQLFNSEKNCDSKDKSLFLVASVTSSHTDRSDLADARISDESCGGKPVFISSIMENSNNAVDSVPLFEVKNENVFKLPITELSFNGTLKHMQKLKPIVDPITALSTCMHYDTAGKINNDVITCSEERSSDSKNDRLIGDNADYQYQNMEQKDSDLDSTSKWNDQSFSSLEASFDSGVRSPDMFSDGEEIVIESESKKFWTFLQNVELYDKKKLKKIQKTLQGVLPPPSVTTINIDVTDMLRKYYTHLPQFNETEILNTNENSRTPTKKVSFVQFPETCDSFQEKTESKAKDVIIGICSTKHQEVLSSTIQVEEIQSFDTEAQKIKASCENTSKFNNTSSSHDQSVDLQLCLETDVKESLWPDVLKCRYHDVYYNLSSHRENYETLLQRYAERFIGAETNTSVTIYSGGTQSPTSASKRKALRLKLAQAKSPGRRLSHLARRRQAFCSAATVGQKAHNSSRMVLIDKKKVVNSADRHGKTRRTPGKKTPRKTPEAGGSGKKKAARRLLLDEAPKRALFVSPEGAALGLTAPKPLGKSRRSLFGSPIGQTESKSTDGASKRKREDDDGDSKRVKMAKSLSFGGDSSEYPLSHLPLQRRASELLSSKNSAELNDSHKKKLLWAVSEALRTHGWRMSCPGFREKASQLARLTRRLLTLPPHAHRLAAPALSTSDTLLKLARRYAFAVIRGRTVEECFRDEETRLADEGKELVTRLGRNANSDSYPTVLERFARGSSSTPSFEDAARARAKRQISFDGADFAEAS